MINPMEETIRYISFDVFKRNADDIKDYFYKLSKEEKSQFRKWIYENKTMKTHLKDKAFEYIMGDINKSQLNRGG